MNIFIKILDYGYTCKFFLKNNRYIKPEMISLLDRCNLQFSDYIALLLRKKTAFDIFTSQIFHLIYKSMIKLPLLLCKTEPLPLTFLFVKYFKFSPQCSGSISGSPFSV